MNKAEAKRFWRFSQYEVSADGRIQGAPGATLESFTLDEPSTTEQARGYRALFEVYELYLSIRARRPDFQAALVNMVDEDSQELHHAVTQWCSSYGLLGIVPHFVRSYRGWPSLVIRNGTVGVRWKTWAAHGAGFRQGVIGIDRYSLTDLQARLPELSRWTAQDEVEQPASVAVVEGMRLDTAQAMVFDYFSGMFFSDGSGTYLARFFPQVNSRQAESYDYPCPQSPQFWQDYSEPIEEFLRFTQELWSIHHELGLRGKSSAQDIAGPISRLNQLIAVLSPEVVMSPNGLLGVALVSSSLLGYLVGELLEDLRSDKLQRRCHYCEQPLTVANPKALYCPEHREAGRKRKQRQKQAKKAKELS